MSDLGLADLRAETRSALEALQLMRPLVEQRRGAGDIREKGPNDFVTATDVLVQSTLQEFLGERHPDIAFVGEEGSASDAIDARRRWLVDPICGTTNYAVGIPLFATNVALVEDGRITASAVADGGSGEMYVAELGRGAWRVGSSHLDRLQVNARNRLVSVDPDFPGGDGLRSFPIAFAIEALKQRRWEIRALSSTIAVPYLASGRLGAAIYGPLSDPLHLAAGVLLAREAGAVITDQSGTEWSLESGVCIVSASPELHAELQSLAAEVYARLSVPRDT